MSLTELFPLFLLQILLNLHNYKRLQTIFKLLLYQMKADIDSDEISYIQTHPFLI